MKWVMIHHIAVTTRANRKRASLAFDDMRLPKVRLETPAALTEFYRANGLSRP